MTRTLCIETTHLPLRELGRFFAIAVERCGKGEQPPQMFSGAVDVAWHDLLQDEDAYSTFCRDHAGRVVAHVPGHGSGVVVWVADYERRFGPLPEIWFTEADGVLREEEWRAYRRTGQVVAQWDCAPKMPDGDGDGIVTPLPPA